MMFEVKGRIFYPNGDERDTVISIEAGDKEEAKFFFAHGVHIEHTPEGTTCRLNMRTLKAKGDADES